MSTNIEWCDETWNPVTGCTPVSEGCRNCYAARMAKRLAGRAGYPKDEPFRPGTVHMDKWYRLAKWKKSRRIFVCSMGDLFHEDVNRYDQRKAFALMHHYKHHLYMVLTKRPFAMQMFIDWYADWAGFGAWPSEYAHIMPGITVENQHQFDIRYGFLMGINHPNRFVSCEPLLGPVDFRGYLPQWVIVGAETGPGARYMDPDWARDIRDQCKEAGVPFFTKKMSVGAPVPDDLMIREFPETKGGNPQ